MSFEQKKAKRFGIIAPAKAKKAAMLPTQLIKNVTVPNAGKNFYKSRKFMISNIKN